MKRKQRASGWRWKRRVKKTGLKLSIQKTKIKASSPITSWQIDGKIMEIVTDLILGGSQITADGYCSHEIKRCLLLRRKSMTKLDSILKSNDVTLSTNVYMSSYGFSSSHVWMWELDHKKGWALKNWCFWNVVFRVHWTARRSNQSILKKISPECSLKGLMVKLQYFGHLMQRANSLEKTLMLGKIEDKRRKGWQKMRWLDGITDSMDMCFSKLWGIWRTGKAGVLQSMGSQRVGHDLATEQ